MLIASDCDMKQTLSEEEREGTVDWADKPEEKEWGTAMIIFAGANVANLLPTNSKKRNTNINKSY